MKVKRTEFAIVDIETTGGYAAASGITEIAIIIHDGENIIERFETLINPGKNIPLYIQSLTGIDNEMVAASPYFEDIAVQIFKLLQGRVFVAHSVNFDYSFLKHHLEVAGYNLNVPKLCTVRLSRKIVPGLASYSLGRLCDSLQIPLHNRHRAGGDAAATAILFSQLMKWDKQGMIAAMLKRNSKEQSLPPNVPKSDFEALPSCPGVYYFINRSGKVIYVGKAIDIKKRVSSHFTGHTADARRQHFMRDVFHISFEVCATELMALILEANEINRLWPQYNRAMKRQEPKYGLYCYEDINGYMRLVIGKYNKFQVPIHVFYREEEGRSILHKLRRRFGLCAAYCGLGTCTHEQDNEDNCIAITDKDAYNQRVHAAIADYTSCLPSFAIIDRGRSAGEQSCIWVENDCFYGMGYLDVTNQWCEQEEIKSVLQRYQSNYYIMQLIRNYAQKFPYKVSYFDTKLAKEEELH
jgi:DNA polymerase-3 subunit epsilon